MASKRMATLRSAAARDYTFNPQTARTFRDGFTAGWEARGMVMIAKEIKDIDRQRRDAGLSDLSRASRRRR